MVLLTIAYVESSVTFLLTMLTFDLVVCIKYGRVCIQQVQVYVMLVWVKKHKAKLLVACVLVAGE